MEKKILLARKDPKGSGELSGVTGVFLIGFKGFVFVMLFLKKKSEKKGFWGFGFLKGKNTYS